MSFWKAPKKITSQLTVPRLYLTRIRVCKPSPKYRPSVQNQLIIYFLCRRGQQTRREYITINVVRVRQSLRACLKRIRRTTQSWVKRWTSANTLANSGMTIRPLSFLRRTVIFMGRTTFETTGTKKLPIPSSIWIFIRAESSITELHVRSYIYSPSRSLINFLASFDYVPYRYGKRCFDIYGMIHQWLETFI